MPNAPRFINRTLEAIKEMNAGPPAAPLGARKKRALGPETEPRSPATDGDRIVDAVASVFERGTSASEAGHDERGPVAPQALTSTRVLLPGGERLPSPALRSEGSAQVPAPRGEDQHQSEPLVSAPKSKRGFQKGNTFGRNSRGNPRGNVKHGASSLARGKGETETARRERKLEEAKRARGGKPTRAQYLINFTKQLEAEVDAAIDALGLATHPVGVLLRRRLVENGMAIERLRIYTNNYGVMDKYQRPKPAFLLYLELQQKDRIELRMMLEKLSVFAGDKEGSKPVTWSFENAPEIGIPDQEEEA